MMWIVFSALLIVLILPYLFIKHLSWGVLRMGSGSDNSIGLTFDDGPDPAITPRILEILSNHGVTATFFVSGDAADARPDLIQRLIAEGHEIGSHSYRHRHALFQRWPLEGFFDARKGLQRLFTLTGRKPRFFRPPWGAYSWALFFYLKLSNLEPVHWTVESHDWHPRYSPSDVVNKVLAETKAASIVVMHDGGRGGANALHALDEILCGFSERGLRPVPLSRMKLRSGFPWVAGVFS